MAVCEVLVGGWGGGALWSMVKGVCQVLVCVCVVGVGWGVSGVLVCVCVGGGYVRNVGVCEVCVCVCGGGGMSGVLV